MPVIFKQWETDAIGEANTKCKRGAAHRKGTVFGAGEVVQQAGRLPPVDQPRFIPQHP